jgi:hypothetical protein
VKILHQSNRITCRAGAETPVRELVTRTTVRLLRGRAIADRCRDGDARLLARRSRSRIRKPPLFRLAAGADHRFGR